MSEEDITLVAENCSFTVSRNVLSKHSHYFAAALDSGLSESTSGRFVFPELTASQLALFVRAASLGFNTWPGMLSNNHMSDELLNSAVCPVRHELIQVLELTTVADYFQTPALTRLCLAQLLDLLTRLFVTGSIKLHEQHGCDILRDFLFLWAKFLREHTNSVSGVLFTFAARHPSHILKPFLPTVCTPPIQDAVLTLATSLLSSDYLCIYDETQVLQFVLDWIYYLRMRNIASSHVIQQFFDALRLGLITHQGQSRLLQFWREFYPDIKWHEQFGCDNFSDLLTTSDLSGPFSGVVNNVRRVPLNPMLFRSRAPTPCVISLLQSLKDGSIELWLFDLTTGNHYVRELPGVIVDQLSNNSVKCGDLSNRIYLCHPSTQKDSNEGSILLICYDPVNTGSLSGFIWCLATGQAQWIPTLILHSNGEQRNTGRKSSSSILFRSRRVGLITLDDGVYVYYASATQSDVLLHVARLDQSDWTWKEFPPVSLASDVGNAVVLFTPVEQLSTVSSDTWMYCSVEVTSRSETRIQPVWRHNLHQTSLICSRFYRFRPIRGSELSNRQLQLDLLPSAPFLIRIYHVLPLYVCTKGASDAKAREYLFAFGTCSRDERATQFCLDLTARQWIEWSIGDHSFGDTGSPLHTSTFQTQIKTNLCPKLLGFRGLVCATTLSHVENSELDSATSEQSNCEPDCTKANPLKEASASTGPAPALLNPSLVLIGRPDYRFKDTGHSSSGIWFHYPEIYFDQPDQPITMLDSSKPAFSLPTSVTQALSHSTSPAAVVHANWNNIVHSPELFRFLNSHPNEYQGKRLHSSPDMDQRIRLPCFNHPWNWSACDSD